MSDELAGLPKLVREYCMSKLVIENRSPKTVSEYANDLRTFFKYMRVYKEYLNIDISDNKALSEVDITSLGLDFFNDITTVDVYEFLIYAQNTRGNAWSARARKLSALKGFYRYLTVKMRLTEHNPVQNIEAPKAKKTLPKFMTLEEAQIFLNTIAEDTESKTLDRDYAIVTLFLNCGMRLSELVGINLSDISSDMETLRVVGKGAKERMIYLNDACRDALGTYLTVRAADPGIIDKNALFLSGRGTRISNKTVQWMVGKYLKLAGFEHKRLSVHKLRHTAATLMYRTGKVDVRVLKDILGHEQLNTTQIYTHVSDELMKAAIDSNPIAGTRK
ncbi:MAG: tyrosine recombinase XerC [Clostridia bacterium]|nr:tyrosine recombinase XerC [Clostridia bacterium]